MSGVRYITERELIAQIEAAHAGFDDATDADDAYFGDDREWDAVDELEAREIEEDREYADHLADVREGRA
jgi:hypothetical protein